jgi:8-oxo-dGTP pyrophosphatase MutT (NUDIX family)
LDDDVEFRPDGSQGTYVRWQWRAPFSIAVLPILDARSALLVRSYRHAARSPILEVVKGSGDEDKAPADVAREELRQEIGYEADIIRPMGSVVTDPAFCFHPMHCFVAWGDCRSPVEPESSEVIVSVEKLHLASIPAFIASGEVSDAVTIVLLWQAYWTEPGHAQAG